jgi:hypothetical protein
MFAQLDEGIPEWLLKHFSKAWTMYDWLGREAAQKELLPLTYAG